MVVRKASRLLKVGRTDVTTVLALGDMGHSLALSTLGTATPFDPHMTMSPVPLCSDVGGHMKRIAPNKYEGRVRLHHRC
jgi:hypothetical protein